MEDFEILEILRKVAGSLEDLSGKLFRRCLDPTYTLHLSQRVALSHRRQLPHGVKDRHTAPRLDRRPTDKQSLSAGTPTATLRSCGALATGHLSEQVGR